MPSKVILNWINSNPNKASGKVFIYRSEYAFNADGLPELLATVYDSNASSYEDLTVKEGQTLFYMLAYGELAQRSYSDLVQVAVQFGNNYPIGLTVDLVNGTYHMNWAYARLVGNGFNIYTSSNSFDENSLPEPKYTKVQSFNFVDNNVDQRRANFIRVGIKKGDIEYLSNEIKIDSEYAYNIEIGVENGEIVTRWNHDNSASTTFKIYCEDAPIDPQNLPEPKATLTGALSHTQALGNTRKYVRIAATRNGLDYLSDEKSFIAIPYNLKTVYEDGAMYSTWAVDQGSFEQMNYYCADTPIDVNAPPEPTQRGLADFMHIDNSVDVVGIKHIRIGMVINGQEYFSDEYIYGYPYAYSFSTEVTAGKLVVNWKFDTNRFDTFNYYCEESTIDPQSLPVPKMSGLGVRSTIDPISQPYGVKYMRVGAVRAGIEYLSDEFTYKYEKPHSVFAANISNKLGIDWVSDYSDVDYFNYYCEESPIDPQSLPAPKATGLQGNQYIDNETSLIGLKYMRIGAVRAGNEVLSDEFEYGYTHPYDLTAVGAESIKANWQYDRVIGAGFDYYCEDDPINLAALPVPKATGIKALDYEDQVSSLYGVKYMLINMSRGGRNHFADAFIYRYHSPYQLTLQRIDEQFNYAWGYDHPIGTGFKFYCEPTSIDVAALPAPKKTDINALNLADESGKYGRKYMRIGIVRDGVEYLSDEIEYAYERPYALTGTLTDDQLALTWDYDFAVDTGFKLYCESSTIDPENLPEAKAIDLTTLMHTLTLEAPETAYFVRVGVVRDGIEYLSDELDTSSLI